MLKKVLGLLVVCGLIVGQAHARIRIDITNPNADPIPLAIPVLHADSPTDADMASDIMNVITNNFNNSALFEVTDKEAYLQDSSSLFAGGPVYKDWRLINVDAVLSAAVKRVIVGGEEKIRVDFHLYDVHDEKPLVGRYYTAKSKDWRHVAHRISDDIFQALTGEEGYFATRIVHIGEEQKPNGHTVKKLCVMDQDGAGYLCLTDGSHLVLTPRYNREVQKIIYMSYAKGVPRLYLLDLPTGQQTLLGDYKGLNSSPRFAPDSQTVAMTLTQGHEGNPEIYTMDLNTRKLNRLTRHRAIDTSPSFSPDGTQIVFNSDRGGKPSLYVMNRDGTNVRRLTFGKGKYFAPVWSPRGDLIAFVKSLNGTFHIGVIDVEGNEERLLTDSFLDESPTWSPNGRVIAFARQDRRTGRTKIMSIDLTGHNLRELKTPRDASDPAWSPLIRSE
ncbi:MAG: Tol-Pal system beta propeller repeat protein TolB [Alphaproteobacteria bacterium]|nr:Tol-Pal system beta propeller repeat protein TolB [Alphaproteobacteria bacterium]MDD9920516.1 Tol-Pal system beta propeller repeat protein TolB [Alphaproteobacteria bacterium]